MFGNSTAALSHVHKLKCRKSNSHKASKHSNARLKEAQQAAAWGRFEWGPQKDEAILEHCLNRKTQKLARRCMLNYVHTFVGSPLAACRPDPKKSESGHGHRQGPRTRKYGILTTVYRLWRSPCEWACSGLWPGPWVVCMCGFLLANHLISFRFMPLLLLLLLPGSAAVLLRFSSEIYYILITPRGLVVAVKAYF